MAQSLTLLLDFDGVINDASAMLRRYGAVVGRLMAERYDGPPQQWADAHALVMRAMTTWSADMARAVGRSYGLFYREENRRWVVAMFRALRREPPDELSCQELADELRYAVPRQIATPLPGAVDAVRALKAAGFPLVLSSAGCHAHCKGALEALELDSCFRAIYGADLIDQFKDGPRFYDRLLDAEDLDASECVAVDDKGVVISWVHSLGMRSVHVLAEGKAPVPATLAVHGLSQLPLAMGQL